MVEMHAVNDAKKIKELEKRLQAELNLRTGHIGYQFDEDEEMVEEEESKVQSNKKKAVTKKKASKSAIEDGKLKQTRLIFTPKDSIAGNKRP